MHLGELTKMDKLLITRSDAATLLNLSARSIDYLIAKGRLSSRKFGKRRLISRAAVLKFAKSGCGRISPSGDALSQERHF
jgi:excisionase family DNA binding protein